MLSHMPRRSRPRPAPARWCTWAASTCRSSRSCWSRRSRWRARAGPSTWAWWRSTTRWWRTPHRSGPSDIRWPDAIYVDGGLIGGGRLAWPAGTADAAEPDWLVFGATVRLVSLGKEEAGLRPLATALEEEGFDDMGSGRLVESFARHLMLALDAWRAGEMAAVTRTYLDRLRLEKGAIPALGAEGDLLVRWRGKGRAGSARAGRRAGRARPGSIRQPEGRAREAPPHHPARPVRHLRLRAGGGARRMGRAGHALRLQESTWRA